MADKLPQSVEELLAAHKVSMAYKPNPAQAVDTSTAANKAPDWENFGKAIVENWPTSDFNGADLFDLCVTYGLIEEVQGGYNPELHIDADGVCPEMGDPWYEYTFTGGAGAGLYSVHTIFSERDAELAAAMMGAYKEGWSDGAANYHHDRNGTPADEWLLSNSRKSISTDAMAALDAMLAEAEKRGRDGALDELERRLDEIEAGYLSPEYAYPQPVGSIIERMVVGKCKEEIRAMKGGE